MPSKASKRPKSSVETPASAPGRSVLAPAAEPVPTVVVWLVCAFLLVMPLADVALRWTSTKAAGSELTADRSRFAVVNAITLTGFQYSMGLESYSAAGQAIVLLLMLGGILFSLIVGGLAVVRILGLGYSDRQVVRAALFATAVFVAGGAGPLVAGGAGPMQALFLSASAFGNGGLVLGDVGVMNWQTHLVLMPLAFFGALGLPVLMEGADWIRSRRAVSFHSRAVVVFSLGLYVVCCVLFVVMRLGQVDESGGALARLVGSSSVAAMNSHTAGFPFQHAQGFPRTMQWVLVLVMMTGGSSAGTAGGIKTNTVVELVRGVRRALRGEPAGRALGVAAVWVAGYLAIVGACFGMMLAVVPQLGADRLLFETVSAVSNVGLSYEVVNIVSPGLDVMSVAMVAGRLAPVAVLWWMAQTTRGAEVAVG